MYRVSWGEEGNHLKFLRILVSLSDIRHFGGWNDARC